MDREQAKAPLAAWLTGRLPEARNLAVAAIAVPKGGGNSAETSLVDISYDADRGTRTETLVLRKQLEGSDLYLESDLKLPWRVMEGLAGSDVPVPGLVGIEEGRDVLGAPFFVMRKVEGRIVPQYPNYNVQGWFFDLTSAQQARLWRNGVEMLAQIHKVDWRKNLAFLDRSERGAPGLEQYLADVEAWYLWARNGRDMPVTDAAIAYLKANRPDEAPVSLVWGDANAANMLFADDLSVAAVIDWEVAGLGPGEIDLAWWLMFDEMMGAGAGVARLASLPTRAQTIDIYEQAAGRRAIAIDYFETLAWMRMAIIAMRQADRQSALGRLRPGSTAYLANPMTAQIARRLDLPVPEVGADFAEMLAAATHHQI